MEHPPGDDPPGDAADEKEENRDVGWELEEGEYEDVRNDGDRAGEPAGDRAGERAEARGAGEHAGEEVVEGP